MTVADPVKFAYELSSNDSVMEAAEYVRQAILDAFKNSKELTWPPTADDLDRTPPLPSELISFLEYVISGSNTADCYEHVKRLSCQLVKVSVMDYRIKNGSCLNTFF